MGIIDRLPGTGTKIDHYILCRQPPDKGGFAKIDFDTELSMDLSHLETEPDRETIRGHAKKRDWPPGRYRLQAVTDDDLWGPVAWDFEIEQEEEDPEPKEEEEPSETELLVKEVREMRRELSETEANDLTGAIGNAIAEQVKTGEIPPDEAIQYARHLEGGVNRPSDPVEMGTQIAWQEYQHGRTDRAAEVLETLPDSRQGFSIDALLESGDIQDMTKEDILKIPMLRAGMDPKGFFQDATEGIISGGMAGQRAGQAQADPTDIAEQFTSRGTPRGGQTGAEPSATADPMGTADDDEEPERPERDQTTREVGLVVEPDDIETEQEGTTGDPESSVEGSAANEDISNDGEDAESAAVVSDPGKTPEKGQETRDQGAGIPDDQTIENNTSSADPAKTYRCEFPTGNGPCQNIVDDPEARCHIEAHQNEDEIAAAQAQAEQADSIEEYPDGEDVLNTLSDNDGPDGAVESGGGDGNGE